MGGTKCRCRECPYCLDRSEKSRQAMKVMHARYSTDTRKDWARRGGSTPGDEKARRGGLAAAATLGPKGMAERGRKGGQTRFAQLGVEGMRAMASLGGKAAAAKQSAAEKEARARKASIARWGVKEPKPAVQVEVRRGCATCRYATASSKAELGYLCSRSAMVCKPYGAATLWEEMK